DPLGGINTLFPLFGIANQLLAAIALAVCLTIVARKSGAARYLWVVAVPLAFAAVVTITASMYKIFSPVPAVGYWAQHFAFRAALDRGETSFGTATSREAMEAVVRNTFVQGTLSIVFVAPAITVIVISVVQAVKLVRAGGGPSTELPAEPSRRYAPAGLIATRAERELMKQWDNLPEDKKPAGVGH